MAARSSRSLSQVGLRLLLGGLDAARKSRRTARRGGPWPARWVARSRSSSRRPAGSRRVWMLLRRPRQLLEAFFCASLGLPGATGSRCCGGECSRPGCDGVDLRFGGVRVATMRSSSTRSAVASSSWRVPWASSTTVQMASVYPL